MESQNNHSELTLSDFAEEGFSVPELEDCNAANQFIAAASLTVILAKITTHYFSVRTAHLDLEVSETESTLAMFEEELELWRNRSLAPLLTKSAFPDPTGKDISSFFIVRCNGLLNQDTGSLELAYY